MLFENLIGLLFNLLFSILIFSTNDVVETNDVVNKRVLKIFVIFFHIIPPLLFYNIYCILAKINIINICEYPNFKQ